MNTEQERERFEAWAKSRGYSVEKFGNGVYVDDRIPVAEAAWQARAAEAERATVECATCGAAVVDQSWPGGSAVVKSCLTTEAPEGWKLVPVRPTKEMLAATLTRGPGSTEWTLGLAGYAAMLDAVLNPPVQTGNAPDGVATQPATDKDCLTVGTDTSTDDPREFGAGIVPSPGMRYWQRRSAEWMSRAVALGWRDHRDACQEAGVDPDTTSPERVSNSYTLPEGVAEGLRFIGNMQEADWPGQGADDEELARHWFAAFKRKAERAKTMLADVSVAAPPADAPHAVVATDAMVTRFLGWKLPKDFAPDCGVSFTPIDHPLLWPTGTNLLHAGQAKEMLTHVLAGATADARDAEIARLQSLLNTPELHDFTKAVVLEAAHQRERWGTDHDAGNAPADWFWLVGYLAGKALASHIAGNSGKALHHTISTSAALANWHAAISGEHTAMQPGHAPSAVLAEQTKADRAMGATKE